MKEGSFNLVHWPTPISFSTLHVCVSLFKFWSFSDSGTDV